MQLMIGLGRTGANTVLRLMNPRHSCVVFDRSPQVVGETTASIARVRIVLKPLTATVGKPE
jgi:6-phosphogluconate dehydrogenase (decarboxylating)